MLLAAVTAACLGGAAFWLGRDDARPPAARNGLAAYAAALEARAAASSTPTSPAAGPRLVMKDGVALGDGRLGLPGLAAAAPARPPVRRAVPRAPAAGSSDVAASAASPGVAAAARQPAAPEPAASPPEATATASRPAPNPLSEEIAHLARAHALLARDPEQALFMVEEGQQRFPNGALAEEREVIAIHALVEIGLEDDARLRAKRFLRRYPDSHSAADIRRIAGRDVRGKP
ncbi:hypothetical protein [Sorangium sp. So ce394]|uniref:hypothetical protein n=1 Tax=Sorangium sp. So ce394 TaxID=3133310 RepID=UPI003F5C4076